MLESSKSAAWNGLGYEHINTGWKTKSWRIEDWNLRYNRAQIKMVLFYNCKMLCVKTDLQDEKIAEGNCLCPNIFLIPFSALWFPPFPYIHTKFIFLQVAILFWFWNEKIEGCSKSNFHIFPMSYFSGFLFPQQSVSLSKSLLFVLIKQPTHFPAVFPLSRIIFWTDIL